MFWLLACAVCAALAVVVVRPCTPGHRRLARVGRAGSVGAGRAGGAGGAGRTPTRPVDAQPPPAPALTPADVALLADQVAALAVAGLPPPRIWAAVAEHGPSVAVRTVGAVVVAQGRRGVSPGRALRTHLLTGPGRPRRAPCPAAVQLAIALDVSERTGAGTAPTLHRFAEALRADERAAQERAAALAGPQATAGVLALLPLAGLALGALLGGRPWHALLATDVGRASLLGGSLLWLVGRRWTAHLVRRAGGSS